VSETVLIRAQIFQTVHRLKNRAKLATGRERAWSSERGTRCPTRQPWIATFFS